MKLPHIALIGNPNSGKSSIFNALTGLRQKIGNYPGVTVDKKTGRIALPNGSHVLLSDLPGTYSLYPRGTDEQIVYDILLDNNHNDHPDGIVAVVDASNLKRNLLLCSQVIDLGIPMVVALSMTDLARKDRAALDVSELSRALGVPVVPVNARKGTGLSELKAAIEQNLTQPKSAFLELSFVDKTFLETAAKVFPDANPYILAQYAISNGTLQHRLGDGLAEVKGLAKKHGLLKSEFQAKETLGRYRKINEVVDAVHRDPEPTDSERFTDRLDRILTHRIWGYAIMLLVLFAVFQAIFSLAAYPMSLVESGTAIASAWLSGILPDGWFSSLLIDGVLAGIGGVVIFIPQIAILFGFLTILEETGYMSRISYLSDRIMRSVGLSGKSVVPLMSGLACAIPAIMATRNISSWKERIITIMVTPLMSCSARLPVYTLLISLTVPTEKYLGVINLQGLTLLALYLLGLAMALIVALVFNRILRISSQGVFLMEMPIYRPPRWRNVLYTMVEKAKVFTVEAGKIIVVISIVLWVLASYGPADLGWGKMADPAAATLADMDEDALKLRESFAGHFGRTIEPAIRPLGFDWKIGIALLTSFAAREVFVGTMATIYSVESDEENFDSVRERMAADTFPDSGRSVYTLATAFSLLIFFAFAMQCMSTLAVVYRETKSWKWPAIQAVYMTALAYFASLLTYQLLA